jgi:hypothetical protein
MTRALAGDHFDIEAYERASLAAILDRACVYAEPAV